MFWPCGVYTKWESKKTVKITLTLLRTYLPGLFWPRGCLMFPLWRLRLGFLVVPVNPGLITSHHDVQEFGVAVCGVQHVLHDFQTELLLLHRLQLRHEFRGHSPQGQIIGQNGMYRTNAYPHLLRKFSDGDTTALHDQIPHLINELVISACWGPTGTNVTLPRGGAIFESVVPLLNLCDAHGIVAENPLNLPNCFHLAIAKLLAKFDAIPLLESFRHFRRK